MTGKMRGRLWAAVVVLTALASAPVRAAADESCRPNRIDFRSDAGQSRFTVEIADDEAERERGLMERTDLAESAGMLFIFDTPQQAAFWMKNTPLPLDIIFIDMRGVVDSIAAETTPYSEDILRSVGPVKAVLEINGGLSARYGIKPGAEARNPVFSASDPAWPCE